MASVSLNAALEFKMQTAGYSVEHAVSPGRRIRLHERKSLQFRCEALLS